MHLRDEELEMYALERLPPQQISAVESHLTACRACAGKLPGLISVALQLKILGRRAPFANGEYPRPHPFITGEPAQMRLLSPFSPDTLEIRVLDISSSDLRVILASRLPVQSVAQVFCKESIIVGDVRYCVRSGSAYQLAMIIRNRFSHNSRERLPLAIGARACYGT